MIIFPAIDLIGNQAVRLTQGDYGKMTVYDPNPLAVAAGFREKGAEYLHLVDLEGARAGEALQMPLISRVIEQCGLKTQVGGGIRDEKTVARYIEAGAFRVILGTAALEDEAFLIRMVRAYGDKIAVGVDLMNGMAATRGWTRHSGVSGLDFCRRLSALGVGGVVVTDISRDGMLKGTNLDYYKTLGAQSPLAVTASGGVSSLEDVAALRGLGLWGAIIGKALYTGKIDLEKALEAAA